MTTDSELTPGAVDALKNYRRGKRARDRQEWLSKATAIAFVIMVLLLSWYYIAQVSTTAGLRSADATHAAEISSIQDSLKGVCRKVPDPVLSPGQQDACSRAENNVAPAPVIVPGPGGLTTDQVRAIVAAQLANAPAPLTVQEVTDLAASLIAKNPPPAGPPGADATTAQVLAVVTQVCANDACRGPAGADGKPGEPASPQMVTDAAIAAAPAAAAQAVKDYCDQHTACTGTNGNDGAPGRGILSVGYRWNPDDPTQCQQVVTYTQPPGPPDNVQYVLINPTLCTPPVTSPPT